MNNIQFSSFSWGVSSWTEAKIWASKKEAKEGEKASVMFARLRVKEKRKDARNCEHMIGCVESWNGAFRNMC